MRKSLIFSIILTFVMVIMLSACSSTTESGSSGSGNVVKLTYKSLAWIPSEQDMTKQIIGEWNKAHPNIQVQYVQGDWASVQQELLTSFQTGDVPDIFAYWASPIMEWKDHGFLADLSPMLDKNMVHDVSPDVWNLFKKGNQVVALPFEYETDVIFYNKKIFADKGITPPTIDRPWTLDDMRNAALKLTDPSKGIYGLSMNGMGFASRFANETWAIKKGLSLVNNQGKIEVTPDYKDFMKWLHDLVYVDKVMPKNSFTDSFDPMPGFTSGKYAMIAGTGIWDRSLLLTQNKDKIDWGMAPPPKGTIMGEYGAIQTLSVPAKSKHQKEAMEFLKFFWNTQNQAKIGKSAFIFPGRKSALDQPQFKTDDNYWNLSVKLSQNLVIPKFVSTPGWGQFIEGTGKTLYQNYFNNQISLNQFAQQVEQQGNAILEQAKQ